MEKMEKMGEMGVSVCGKWEESEKQKRGKMVCGWRERGWKKRGVVETKRGKSTSSWGQEKSRGKSVRGQEEKVTGKVKGEILEKKTPHAGLEPATLSLEG